MAAWCSGSQSTPALNFTNLCALLKIEMPSDFASSGKQMAYIRVSSSNTPLWGKATIRGTTSPTLSSPTIGELYANDNSVTLDFTQNGIYGADGNSGTTTSGVATGVNSDGPFYVVLPPATDVRDLTIDVYVFTGTSDNRRTVRLYHMDQSTNSTSTQQINILYNTIYGVGSLPSQDQSVEPGDLPYPGLGTGIFSVSRTKKVRFATGNLQYQASTGTWRFALNQWDALGSANSNISQTNVNWIDLFGYGTSGYNNKKPWYSSTNTNNYASDAIQNTQYDWGVNEISNGGNQPNKWRTLNQTEWYYLLNNRSNANNLHIPYTLVDGHKGTIILPDGYTLPSEFTGYNFRWANGISSSQWNTLAAGGAVFLPFTGQREGTTINSINNNAKGVYWTSAWDRDYANKPVYLYFDRDGDNLGTSIFGITTYLSCDRFLGNAVRLVRDVN